MSLAFLIAGKGKLARSSGFDFRSEDLRRTGVGDGVVGDGVIGDGVIGESSTGESSTLRIPLMERMMQERESRFDFSGGGILDEEIDSEDVDFEMATSYSASISCRHAIPSKKRHSFTCISEQYLKRPTCGRYLRIDHAIACLEQWVVDHFAVLNPIQIESMVTQPSQEGQALEVVNAKTCKHIRSYINTMHEITVLHNNTGPHVLAASSACSALTWA